MHPRPWLPWAVVLSAVLICSSLPATSGVHLWRVKEVFSNADGSVQFIEIATCCGSTSENFLSGQHVRSATTGGDFMFPANVTGSTLNKHVLLATDGYAALPGGPPRDHEIPANFFSTAGDTINFAVYDTLTFGAGALPTDGTRSLNKNPDDATHTVFPATNSPTNYAGDAGTINAVSGPPGVPDGTGGSTPMTVQALTADGSSLSIAFDTTACTNEANHHILYFQRSGFPAIPGGTYTPLGSECNIGTASPYSWTNVPSPTDGSGLLWFLVVATDASVVEGSWGVDRLQNERNGPGNNGASGTCALVKSVANTCGHVSP